MSSLRKFFAQLKKERSLTLDELGDLLATKAGDREVRGRRRIGAWFSREGIPVGALPTMCQVFGVSRADVIRHMDDEDLLRYQSFLIDESRLARLLRRFGERSAEEQEKILALLEAELAPR